MVFSQLLCSSVVWGTNFTHPVCPLAVFQIYVAPCCAVFSFTSLVTHSLDLSKNNYCIKVEAHNFFKCIFNLVS